MRGGVFGLLLLALGCSSGVKLTLAKVDQPLQLRGAFVYPFAFRYEQPAYRSFELSQRLIDVALQSSGERLEVWGPSEFKVMRPEDDGAWVATTALPLLLKSGARPEQGVIIRPWAEKRLSSSSHDVQDAKGRGRGGSISEETTYLGHVEVVYPTNQQVLIEATGEVKVDPFTEPPPEAEFDPEPQLTALMEKLMAAAMKKLKPHLAERDVTQALPPLKVAVTPAAALRFADSRPSAELEMARMDAVELELFQQARAKYLSPELTDSEASAAIKLPAGLLVRTQPDDGRTMVAAGDVITAIDDAPALPQVLARLRFAAAPASIKVRQKSGAIIEAVLP